MNDFKNSNQGKHVLYRIIHAFIMFVLVFNMSYLGVFFSIEEASADVGDISISNIENLGGGDYKIYGFWKPQGNQCWTNGGGGTFHYKIEITDNGTTLQPAPMVNPAACNGDFTSPVSNSDNGKEGSWPAVGQDEAKFSLDPGPHEICAVLIHVNDNGNDIGQTTVCYGEDIIVPSDDCPSDPNKTTPGICGCGEVDSGDTDGDGTLDCIDSCDDSKDSDEDGIGDSCDTCNDIDGDGYGNPGSSSCEYPEPDCNDNDEYINPGATELCDSIDNNCSGIADETFEDLGDVCNRGVGECNEGGTMVCSEDMLSTVCNAIPGDSVLEICDGGDNDCDGEIDDGFERITCGEGACQNVVDSCVEGETQTCTPLDNESTEQCYNKIDDDCDGYTDEDCFDLDADFTSTGPVCNGTTVNFNDDSAGGAPSFTYSWDFGDSSGLSTEENPSHLYAAPGTYTVTLTVTDSGAVSDSESMDVVIYAEPSADFTFDPSSGFAPLPVSFTDASTAGDGTMNAWSWDFGDGSLGSLEQNILSHIYSAAGTYSVEHTVTDSNGCSASIVKDISVSLDECLDDPNKTSPGVCGCGVEDVNSNDDDGIYDCNDNCDFTYNPDQIDYDEDSIGDACDECVDVNHNQICDGDEVCASSISGFKYLSKSDWQLGDWLISLYSGDTLIKTASTSNEGGNYSFTNLCSGDYTVRETLKDGWKQVYPMTVELVNYHSVKLGTNTTLTNVNFENQPGICGYKFNQNTQGTVPNWPISLMSIGEVSTEIASTTTDNNGYYCLYPEPNVEATYIVKEKIGGDWIYGGWNPYTVDGDVQEVVFNGSTPVLNVNFYNVPPSDSNGRCGDETTDTELGETCDDGNNVSGDGCSATCLVEEAVCSVGPVELLNPSFEYPLVNTETYWDLFDSASVDWTVSPGSLEIQGGVAPSWTASLGNQYAELDGNAPSTISQNPDTFIGALYTLSYDFSPRPGVEDNKLNVYVNDVLVATHIASGTDLTATDWTTYSYNFVASASTTKITFADGSTPDQLGTFLDNVRLNITACQTAPDDNSVCADGIIEGREACDSGSDNGKPGFCNSQCTSTTSGGSSSSSSGGTPLYLLTSRTTPLNETPAPSDEPASEDDVIVLGEEGAASLQIMKKVDQKLANPGDTLNYTVIISNSGNLSAFNVKVVDELPEGLLFTENSSRSFTWDIGTLAEGESKELNYMVKISDTAEEKIYTNVATLSADNIDDVKAMADVEVTEVQVLAETGFRMIELITLSFLSLSALFVSRNTRKKFEI